MNKEIIQQIIEDYKKKIDYIYLAPDSEEKDSRIGKYETFTTELNNILRESNV